MIEIIEKYFPNLTEEQKKQFEALDALYRDWNSQDQCHQPQGHR